MSRWRHVGVVGAALVATLVCAAAPSAAEGNLSVDVDRTQVETSLGGKFGFETTVVNNGTTTTTPLVAHMTIFSLRQGPYVDPEDWSSQRTKYLAPIPAGASRTVAWNVQAVNDGSFAASVEVLPRTGAGTPAIAPAVRVEVARRETLNAGGILPLALGVPALVGLLYGGIHVTRRRR